jgi:hypothetical protein
MMLYNTVKPVLRGHLLWCYIIVKPVLRGHLLDKEKVVFQDRWPINSGSNFLGLDKKKITF